MKKKRPNMILVSLLVMSIAAFGQGQGAGMQNRHKVRENMATLRLLRMTQALDLSEEQAAKIFPAVNKIEREKLDIQKDMSADIRDLRQLLKSVSPIEAEVEAKIKNVKEARRLIRQKDDDLEAFFENNLTTIQRGKYVLFQIEFYRVLEQSLDRMRIMRNNPPPAPVKK